jgi:tRNA(His) guanylyltransferase
MELAERMKLYESQTTQLRLLPKLPILCRLDGINFSGFTHSLKSKSKPYDERLSNLMIETTKYLVDLTGARCGYTQSDEITLLLYSDDIDSETYLNRKCYKLNSRLAADCSVYFNEKLEGFLPEKKGDRPSFDCRVWNVPTLEEAANVFLWRERDATKNAISMAAESYYSSEDLRGKNGNERQEMLFQVGVNFNEYPTFFKRGTYVQRMKVKKKMDIEEFDSLPEKHHARLNPDLEFERTVIDALNLPIFGKITNRVDVVFDGQKPVVDSV